MNTELDFKGEANAMVDDLSEYWQDRILKRVQTRLARSERFQLVARTSPGGDPARQMLLTEIRRAIEHFGLVGGHVRAAKEE